MTAQDPWTVKDTMITWSTLLPQVLFCGGLDEGGDDVGPIDGEGHEGHLVVGGLIVVTGGCGDGDQVLLQGSLQESVAKCYDSLLKNSTDKFVSCILRNRHVLECLARLE